MTLEDWRSKEDLVAWASKLFNDRRWKLMMEVMDSSHIRHGQLHIVGTLLGPSQTDCTRQLGRIEGWDLYSNTLALAGLQSHKPADMPEATFPDPNKPE